MMYWLKHVRSSQKIHTVLQTARRPLSLAPFNGQEPPKVLITGKPTVLTLFKEQH